MKRAEKIWTPAEIKDLIECFPNILNQKLSVRYNCGKRSLVRKARELGLKKSEEFRANIDFASYSKGLEPWNKGKKRKLNPNCKKGWFKKGNIAPTKDPDILAKVVKKRNETIRKDKLRLKYGMEPLTKLNLKNLD